MNVPWRNALIAMLLAALPVALFGQGSGPSCNDRCSPPSGGVKLSDFVMIEADTGRVLGGRTQFPVSTQIQVIIDHQNPFKYSYRYEIEEREIELDVIRDFLERANIPGLTPPPPQPPPPPAGMAPSLQCTAFDAGFAELEQAQAEVNTANAAARQELVKLTRHLAAYNQFVQEIEKPIASEAACRDLCGKADGIQGKLKEFVERKTMNAEMSGLERKIILLEEAAKKLKRNVAAGVTTMTDAEKKECNQRLGTIAVQTTLLVQTSQESVKKLKGDVEKLKKLDPKVKAMRQILQEVKNDDNAFVYVDFLEARPSPREFIIKIIRKNRSTKKETTVEKSVRAGRSRFSISAGIGLSFIEQQSFVRQQGIVPGTSGGMGDDGMGGMGDDGVAETTVGNVFAIDDASNEQVGAVLQLNAALFTKRKFSFAWSTGFTVGSSDTSEIGYFTGPSLGFLDNQLFLSVAYHLQEVESLGGGFEIGAPVPAELQDPLPTTTDSESGVLVTVTYKIR